MQAHLLSTNAFSMPKVFNKSEAAYIHLIYLIYLEPGKFQSHPSMGVGIISKYRFNNDDNMLQQLQSDIKYQIETFLPELQTTDVAVGLLDNKSIGIIINTSTGTYSLAYDRETNEMDAGAIYVLDQLLS